MKLFHYAILLAVMLFPNVLDAREMRWDWDAIETSKVSFPRQFKWGVALCEYQNSGEEHCAPSNWTDWEKRPGNIQDGQRSGKSTDFWNRYQEDIERARSLGLNSFRLSVEWSIIEPTKGKFNQGAMDHYRDVCRAIVKVGMTPMVTLHHFTHPRWFEEQGGFENEENLHVFLRFAQYVFTHLSEFVPLWCTFNEPGVYAFMGYIMGAFPPGQKLALRKAARVLKNLLVAHVATYQALKKLPRGQEAQIGFAHSIFYFDTYHDWYPLEKVPCTFLNHVFHGALTRAFREGEFRFCSPLGESIPGISTSLDFIGLNCYSHVLMDLGPTSIVDCIRGKKREPLSLRKNDIPSDFHYPIYPEALYRGIQAVAAFNVPIYITESGIADAADTSRNVFFKRYLYTVSRALEEGFDIRGYYYWTLVDNFEWDNGFKAKFGLYSCDPITGERCLRESAHYLMSVVALNSGFAVCS